VSPEENKAVVRRFYDLFNEGNLEGLGEVFAADALDHDPVPGQAPGLEGVKQSVAPFLSGFPGIQITIEQMIADGDRVADRIVARGTHTGEFLGIPPTGKPVTVKALNMYRIAGGKIVEAWHIEDVFGMMVQLGVVPTPGEGG